MRHGFAFASILVVLFGPGSPARAQDYTVGSYGMWNAQWAWGPGVLENPGIVGILLTRPWNEVEIAEEQYDWSRIDARIAEASASGLKVALSISASPLNAPGWIQSAPGAITIPWLDTGTCTVRRVPVFWDPGFHGAKRRLIRAMGRRYSRNPTVVGVMAAFANFRTNDWYVPHAVVSSGPCGVELDQVQEFLDAGYTTQRMLRIGRDIIGDTARAFPDQIIKLPIGTTHRRLDESASYLAESILSYAYGNRKFGHRVCAQLNSLNTLRPTASELAGLQLSPNSFHYIYRLLRGRPLVGLQMVNAAALGGNNGCQQNGGNVPCDPVAVLDHSVDLGVSYRPLFLEFWTDDSTDPVLAPVLQRATSELQAAGGGAGN